MNSLNASVGLSNREARAAALSGFENLIDWVATAMPIPYPGVTVAVDTKITFQLVSGRELGSSVLKKSFEINEPFWLLMFVSTYTGNGR